MFKKDGKLFGKISVIDVVVLLVIVVLLVGGIRRFSGSEPVQVADENVTMECVLQVKGIREGTAEALKKGGGVSEKETKQYIGKITDVKVEDAKKVLMMEDGSFEIVPMENRYDAYVTIEFTGRAKEDGYFTSANRQIGAGGALNINSKFAQCEGNIFGVRVVE